MDPRCFSTREARNLHNENASFVFLFYFLFSFSHKTSKKHNSQRKAPLDLVYSKIDIAFAVLRAFCVIAYNWQLHKNRGPFICELLTRRHFAAVSVRMHSSLARVALFQGQCTASNEKFGARGRGYCHCAESVWWSAALVEGAGRNLPWWCVQ